jgi:hypothetical protein
LGCHGCLTLLKLKETLGGRACRGQEESKISMRA